MSASKAKIGAALVAVIVGGGGVALKTMSKAARSVDNVAAGAVSTSRNADNFAKLAGEAKLARGVDDGAGALTAANRSAGDTTHAWMTEATWGDVKTNIAESFATEGASRAIEALHEDDPNLQLRAFSSSNPTFAFVPPSNETEALDNTGRSVLLDPDSLQILLNARTNPLMLAAVGERGHIIAPDGSRVEVDGIHYLCRQSQVTCFVIVADNQQDMIELAETYQSVSGTFPGAEVALWRQRWEERLEGSRFSMTVTPYPESEATNALLGFGDNQPGTQGEGETAGSPGDDTVDDESQLAEEYDLAEEEEQAPRKRRRRRRRGR